LAFVFIRNPILTLQRLVTDLSIASFEALLYIITLQGFVTHKSEMVPLDLFSLFEGGAKVCSGCLQMALDWIGLDWVGLDWMNVEVLIFLIFGPFVCFICLFSLVFVVEVFFCVE
jgi:hypothetical protein